MKSNKTLNSVEKYGVVTFLDVLGWKGVWQRKNEAISDLESIVKLIDNRAKRLERGSESSPSSIMIVSDTIVIFTEADLKNVNSKIEFHGQLCAEAIPISIKKGLPLRGATSFGEVVISNTHNIFAGKAIDEAASWHEKADWIGVFLTPSANFIFNNRDSEYWTKYFPPFKAKELGFETYTAIWFNYESSNSVYEIKKDFIQLAPLIPEIVSKFTNTIAYIEETKPQIKENRSN